MQRNTTVRRIFINIFLQELKELEELEGVKDITIYYTVAEAFVFSSSEALQASRVRSPSKLEERDSTKCLSTYWSARTSFYFFNS